MYRLMITYTCTCIIKKLDHLHIMQFQGFISDLVTWGEGWRSGKRWGS